MGVRALSGNLHAVKGLGFRAELVEQGIPWIKYTHLRKASYIAGRPPRNCPEQNKSSRKPTSHRRRIALESPLTFYPHVYIYTYIYIYTYANLPPVDVEVGLGGRGLQHTYIYIYVYQSMYVRASKIPHFLASLLQKTYVPRKRVFHPKCLKDPS